MKRRNALRAALLLCGLGACERASGVEAGAQATPALLALQTHAASAPSAPRRHPEALQLATWNLEWLDAADHAGPVKRSADDYARLRKYANALDADVIAFQEVDGAPAAERVFAPERYRIHVTAQVVPQRTGFAYKRHLAVTPHSDYVLLDVGHLRSGADLSVAFGSSRLRLLSVHLKSGCTQARLGNGKACKKLARQLPALEAWIDERARGGELFAVLGDFNRAFFAERDEPFWREIDDADPPEADLDSPTEGRRPACWNGKFPHFIDHLVLGKSTAALVQPGSFREHLYAASDAPYAPVLSDHCPLSVVLSRGPRRPEPAPEPAPSGAPETPKVAPRAPNPPLPIKGNINKKGRKIYHLPGCPYYAATEIHPERGERLFATEAEAVRAGWRKAGNCP